MEKIGIKIQIFLIEFAQILTEKYIDICIHISDSAELAPT